MIISDDSDDYSLHLLKNQKLSVSEIWLLEDWWEKYVF